MRQQNFTAYSVEDILRTQTAQTSTLFKGTSMSNVLKVVLFSHAVQVLRHISSDMSS